MKVGLTSIIDNVKLKVLCLIHSSMVESDEAEECDEVILVSNGSEAPNSSISDGASFGSDLVSTVAGV
ncbi:hypothetical protein Tco_0515993 [Tanacetum coccineum]